MGVEYYSNLDNNIVNYFGNFLENSLLTSALFKVKLAYESMLVMRVVEGWNTQEHPNRERLKLTALAPPARTK